MKQIDEGKHPFAVLSSMQGAVESLIRQLATKHLSTVHGNEVGHILGAIRVRGNDLCKSVAPDAKQEGKYILWLYNLAEALYGIRCRVVHQPEYPFTRHDVGLFFHGIAVLLSHV